MVNVYDVKIVIGCTGIDESDVENQLDFILDVIRDCQFAYDYKIEKVGELLI